MQLEDINAHPIDHLVNHSSDYPADVQTFVERYLLHLQTQPKKEGKIEIAKPGLRGDHILYMALNQTPPNTRPKVDDPTYFLNKLLYEVMKTGNADLPIASQIVYGFSNCGRGFFQAFRYSFRKDVLLSSYVQFPAILAVETASGDLRWTRAPETGREQMFHFLFFLRATMRHLAQEPIGSKAALTTSEVAQMLTLLPRRAAFIRSGDDMGVIYTGNTPPKRYPSTFKLMVNYIQRNTRDKYCRPKDEVERQFGLHSTPAEDEQSTKNTEQTPNEPDQEEPFSRWEEV